MATSGFHNNVKPIRILSLESVKLSLGIFARQLNILISGTELLSQVHFQTLRGDDYNIAAAILTQHLSQNKTGRSGTKDQHRGSHLGGNLVETVCSTRGRLEESGINVGQVVDLEDPTS